MARSFIGAGGSDEFRSNVEAYRRLRYRFAEAEQGCHDDCVMALALANHIHEGIFTPVVSTDEGPRWAIKPSTVLGLFLDPGGRPLGRFGSLFSSSSNHFGRLLEPFGLPALLLGLDCGLSCVSSSIVNHSGNSVPDEDGMAGNAKHHVGYSVAQLPASWMSSSNDLECNLHHPRSRRQSPREASEAKGNRNRGPH